MEPLVWPLWTQRVPGLNDFRGQLCLCTGQPLREGWCYGACRQPRGCRSQGLPAACSTHPPGAIPTAQSFLLFPPLVYPSLESDEDSPVFKSRSKKRKGSDDAPYSPTGSAGGWEGSSVHTECQWSCCTPTGSVAQTGCLLPAGARLGFHFSPGPSAKCSRKHSKAPRLLPGEQCSAVSQASEPGPRPWLSSTRDAGRVPCAPGPIMAANRVGSGSPNTLPS